MDENSPAHLCNIYGKFNEKKSGDALDFFDNTPKWHTASICLYGDLYFADIIDKYGIKKYVSVEGYANDTDDSIEYKIDLL